MSRNAPLPTALHARGFRVADAHQHAVSRGRLRGLDLATPFHGVRVLRDDAATATTNTTVALV